MHRQHLRTLEALFAHPLEHGLRSSRVEALLRSLGAEVTPIGGGRLRIRMPSGQETWIHPGCGLRSPDLDPEAMMRVRHLLEACAISPDQPLAPSPSPRGDQGLRLVLHLDHTGTDAYRFAGEGVEHERLLPHGIWGSGEHLTHRHDRDIAGQRAPVDHAYLEQIALALKAADAVLLLGHGQGESDLRTLLLRHIRTRHPALLQHIVGIETIDTSALSDPQLLALAHEHFGNRPHRHPLAAPGQERSSG